MVNELKKLNKIQRFFLSAGFALALIILGGTMGCHSNPLHSSMEALLVDAQKQFAAGDYAKAKSYYAVLLEKNPQSEQRAQAILGLADCHFKLYEFDEAIVQYQKFLDLHPVHEEAPRALFFIGLCNFKQMLSIDRDQTKTLEAERNFKLFLERYPNHFLADSAKKKIQICEKNYAQHLFYIGKYYYNTQAYQSTISRMKDLLEKFPDEPFVPEALYYLADSLYHEESYENSLKTFDSLIKLFPRSEYAEKAKKRKKEFGMVETPVPSPEKKKVKGGEGTDGSSQDR